MTPAEWNAKYSVGQAVIVHRDNGEHFRTVTRSEATDIPSNPAVIWVKGIAGCYSLDRVEPAVAPSPETTGSPE